MCTVSITDFNRNPAKYIEIARNERVIIEDEKETFELVKNTCKEGFISANELKSRVHKHIRERFASRK